MHKTFRKNIVRQMRSSLGRFVSIFAITALGAGFFAGLQATSPNMVATADNYYRDQALMDYRLLSTMGFTDEDVEALRALPEVAEVMPTQRLDVLVEADDGVEVARLHALPKDTSDENSAFLNRLDLSEGRLPTAMNECVADDGSAYQIGDVITVSEQTDEDTLDFLRTKSFTVVGRGASPTYITFDRGNTTVGSGSVAFFLYVPQNAFDSEIYTEIYLTASDVAGLSSSSAAYETAIEAGVETLESFGEERAVIRYDDIYSEASEEIADAKQELADARAEAETEFADAEQKLRDGEIELADARAEANAEFADAQQKLDDGQAALDSGKNAIAENSQKLRDAQAEINAGSIALAQAKEQLAQQRAPLDAQAAVLAEQRVQYEAAYAQYSSQKQDYDNALLLLDGITAANTALTQAASSLSALLPGIGAPAVEAQFIQEANAAIASLDALAASLDMAGLTSAAAAVRTAKADAQGFLAASDYAQTSSILAALPTAVQPDVYAARTALTSQAGPLQQAAADLLVWKNTLDAGEQQLAPYLAEIAAAEQQIAEKEALLTASQIEVENGWAQISAAKAQISQAETTLREGRAEFAEKKADAERELANAQADINEGWAEYIEKKEDAEREMADAEIEIADAGHELNDLDVPDWYVYDRSGNPGYSGLAANAERIAAIASTIPVFFYLVAALVCLTTMTRMVEEERTQIGTLKALGFSKGTIAGKYLSYAAFTSAAGGVMGVAIGLFLFPAAIWNAYRIMYNMPSIHYETNLLLAVLSILFSVLCTCLATLAACNNELRSVPAQLMRPKAPKAGTRVILERIPALWNRMRFSQKVTARNLFRYKKRFFMTIVGVAGCTALLLTGFGLRDSITGIAPIQFGEIYQYDIVASLQDPSDSAAATPLNEELSSFGNSLYAFSEPIDAQNMQGAGTDASVTLFVGEDAALTGEFIDFHTRSEQEAIAFPQGDGVIITEKLASLLSLEKGDELRINRAEEDPVNITIAGIMENYVGNSIYMAPDTYTSLFGQAPEYDTVYLILNEEHAEDTPAVLSSLIETDGVAGAVDMDSFKSQVDDMLAGLDSVVWLILLCAALLALVVLYNLTNINITERAREIATLKVLGFYDKEVSNYVYRENVVLTLIGAFAGLALGIILHRYVIITAEVDEVMFRRLVQPLSYVLSLIFTMACTFIVNFIMRPRLRKVDMVESLKSAE